MTSLGRDELLRLLDPLQLTKGGVGGVGNSA
jgi:hypothetical protein